MARVASTEYKRIPIKNLGFEYRIGDMGDVQKQMPDGTWVTISPYKSKQHKLLYVHLRMADGKRKAFPVTYLMDETFFGGYGRKHRLCRTHKNGMVTDCSKYNIIFVTPTELNLKNLHRHLRVVKLDADGKILAHYSSATEAAEANYMSRNAMYNRLHNKIRNPLKVDGCIYKFESELYE